MRQELSGVFCQTPCSRPAGRKCAACGGSPAGGAVPPALFRSRAKPALSNGHWAALELTASRSHTKPGICLSTGFPSRQHFAGALTKPQHPDFPLQGPAGLTSKSTRCGPTGVAMRQREGTSYALGLLPPGQPPSPPLLQARREGTLGTPPNTVCRGLRPRPGSTGRVRPGTVKPRPFTGPWPFDHHHVGVKG